jgi:hypothetical protein
VHRTIRDKLYKYFTYRDTYKYVDVLPKFVKAYNDSIHSTIGMAPKKLQTELFKEFGSVCNRKVNVFVAPKKISCGPTRQNHQRKMIFAKGTEENYSTRIFKIIKVIPKSPRPVHELEDLNQTPIEGKVYAEELTPVRISKRTTFQIDIILDRRVRRGIVECLFKWRGYSQDFNSWVPASSVKNI